MEKITFVDIFTVYMCLFMHPIAMIKCLRHCGSVNHKYALNMYNFNVDLWCADCGKVFLDEIL